MEFPDDVGRDLETLAAREGMSLSAFAVRELGQVARRAQNPSLVGDLRSFGVLAEEVVADLEAERQRR